MISNNVEVYVEPVPRTKKITHLNDSILPHMTILQDLLWESYIILWNPVTFS